MPIKKLPAEILREHKGVSYVGVTTCFLMYTREGEFFMAKRSKNARDEHGRWEIQGGGLKWGMTAEENVVREMLEEGGVNPQKIDFLGYRDVFRQLPDGTPTHWLALDFAVLVDKDKVTINEPDMFDDSGWFTLSTQPSPLHSQHETLMKKHRNKLKKIIKK